MTDVSAQAFREAAEQAEPFPHWVKLFLAAAEQCEQLDMSRAQVTSSDHAASEMFKRKDEQIATLTDEVDMVRRAYETVQDNEFAARSPSTHAQNLAQQVRTLTAENEQFRTALQKLSQEGRLEQSATLREQLEAARANAELQSHGRRLAEDNQIRAYRLQDEALKERDEALTAMASAMATIAAVIEWAEKNDYGKEADGDLWRILKSHDTSPATNPLEEGPSHE